MSNEPIPYVTKDFAEAVTLASCGVPFYYPERRMMNVYRANKLKEMGVTLRQAVDRGIEGEKAWIFVKNEDCTKVMRAFKEAWNKEKDFQQVLQDFDISELALTIATGLRNRKELSGDWKFVPPQLAIDRGDGQLTIISENTPKEALERWNIEF